MKLERFHGCMSDIFIEKMIFIKELPIFKFKGTLLLLFHFMKSMLLLSFLLLKHIYTDLPAARLISFQYR